MKIATLIPSATEMIYDLGLKSQLVGVSHSCDQSYLGIELPVLTHTIVDKNLSPAEIDAQVMEAVEAQQPLYEVDALLLENILPDLIITQGICDVCAVNSELVNKALSSFETAFPKGVDVLTLSGMNFLGVIRDLRLVAQATEKVAKAETIIEEALERWEVLDSKPKHGLKMLFLEWPKPFFYGGHWIPEMIEVAGGVGAMGQVGEDSGRCTSEEIIESNPDIIVFGACGYDLSTNATHAREFLATPKFSKLKAVKSNQIWAIDANRFCSRPAMGIVKGAERFSELFRGQVSNGVERVV